VKQNERKNIAIQNHTFEQKDFEYALEIVVG
jgi:hypothetical protein